MKTEKKIRLCNQVFIPIMVEDGIDTCLLVESAVKAGCDVIEYTCRRKDARKMIPWIKKEYPDMIVLGASLVDGVRSSSLLKAAKENFITVDEMVELGVDGLVSFMRFSEETYSKYGNDKIMIPGVETYNEAFTQMEWGADFIKIYGNNPLGSGFIRAGYQATHGLFPFFVSGGMKDESIRTYMRDGAVLCAAGFDLICSEKIQGPASMENLSVAIREKCEIARNARNSRLHS